MTEGPAAAGKPSRTRPHLGLSGKLLVLTLLFVMVAEVLIYVPSVANFRLNWLNDRLSAAYTAALVFETAPNGMVTDTVARQILDSIRARAVGFTYAFSRISTVFVSFMIGFFLQKGGVPAVFAFIAVSMLIVMLSIGLFGPRTRGLQLERISH